MSTTPAHPRPVALLLPGQGSQHERMAHGLYRRVAAFTEPLDEVLELLGAEGERVRRDWLAERPAVPLDDAARAQPLLFAVDYALSRMLTAWGVVPTALVGHSVGESVAAVLAGVIALPDAVGLLAERVALFAEAPPGGMLAVAAGPAQVAGYLTEDVVVGAVNAPQQVLLAGPDPALAEVAQRLRADGVMCMRAKATVGFHSPSLLPVCRLSSAGVAAVPLHAPRVALYSGRAGARLDAAGARQPLFWAMQPAEPVYFWAALDALLTSGRYLLVEAGPGQGLSALARRHPQVAAGHSGVLPLLGSRPRGPAEDPRRVERAVAALNAEGHDVRPAGLPSEITPVSPAGAPG
jgi:[acyl-carrier-protein] S-malonyltransferase